MVRSSTASLKKTLGKCSKVVINTGLQEVAIYGSAAATASMYGSAVEATTETICKYAHIIGMSVTGALIWAKHINRTSLLNKNKTSFNPSKRINWIKFTKIILNTLEILVEIFLAHGFFLEFELFVPTASEDPSFENKVYISDELFEYCLIPIAAFFAILTAPKSRAFLKSVIKEFQQDLSTIQADSTTSPGGGHQSIIKAFTAIVNVLASTTPQHNGSPALDNNRRRLSTKIFDSIIDFFASAGQSHLVIQISIRILSRICQRDLIHNWFAKSITFAVIGLGAARGAYGSLGIYEGRGKKFLNTPPAKTFSETIHPYDKKWADKFTWIAAFCFGYILFELFMKCPRPFFIINGSLLLGVILIAMAIYYFDKVCSKKIIQTSLSINARTPLLYHDSQRIAAIAEIQSNTRHSSESSQEQTPALREAIEAEADSSSQQLK